ncbi:MAG: hypothetical protein ACO1RA_09380 [Planctomycetaceae bacterium]
MARNQRRSLRSQVHNDRQIATLIVNSRHRFSVRVIDESAGGFAIVSPFRLPIAENQDAELITSWTHSVVRLARIEQYPDGQLIGVSRVRDVTAESSASTSDRWLSQFRRIARMITSRAVAGGAIGLFAATLLIMLMAASMASWDRKAGSPDIQESLTILSNVHPTAAVHVAQPNVNSAVPGTSKSPGEMSFVRGKSRSAAKSAAQQHAKKTQSLVSSTPQLTDLLSNPKVVQQLHLTKGQQQQIDALLELTANRGYGAPDYAAQAIMEVLSTSQQQQLSQLRYLQ